MRLEKLPENFPLGNEVYMYALNPYISEKHGRGQLWMELTGKHDKDGSPFYRAILIWQEGKQEYAKIIFDDSSFSGWEAPEVLAAAALSFFCATPADFDELGLDNLAGKGYFSSYNLDQLDWVDMHAEAVRELAYWDQNDGKDLEHLLIKGKEDTR